MTESGSETPKIEKGTRHIRTDRIPIERRGAHSPSNKQTEQPRISDEQIEQDFIAAYTPQAEKPAIAPPPIDYKPEIHIEPKSLDPDLRSLVLPANTVLYDDQGEKVMISEALRVEGHWIRPPKGEKGPAKFEIKTLYPSGIQKKGVQAHGEFALRMGPLWSGQKAENKK